MNLTLPQVIGKNVQRLRGAHTLEEVATQGRSLGVRWSGGSVRAIEQGEFKATLETVALLALALDRLEPEGKTARGTITLRDLLDTDQPIALSTKYVTSTEQLLTFLGGGTSGTVLDLKRMLAKMSEGAHEWVEEMESLNLPDDSAGLLLRVEQAGPETATEQRLAKKIDVHVHELRSWSVHLWGKSFEDHRDEIAGPDSTPQKKGRVSRDLLEHIQAAMKTKQHGDD